MKAIRYNTDKYWNCYAIADAETGEILDDAQGYGYKTAQNAYRCWYYKHRDKSKDREKRKKESKIKEWLKKHRKDIEEDLQDAQWYGIKDGTGDINTAVMKDILKEHNLILPDSFSAFDLLKYCMKQKLWL
ncbi:MAG: hypothetical protein J6N45_07850 [Alphaproteobacteria bacterium]|nr:hypothetical protein [Alphaproteobacteria bacterium]